MKQADSIFRELDLKIDQEWQEALQDPDSWNGLSSSQTTRRSLRRNDDAINRLGRNRPTTQHIDDIANVVPVGLLAADAYINRKRIEATVCTWPISFPAGLDRRVEDVHFPNVVSLYLDTFVRKDFPTSPESFIEELCQAVRDNHRYLSTADIRFRALRFLCSLVRQHHFSCLLQESFDFVVWSERLDRAYGIDLLVIHKARALGIEMTLSGKRAAYWGKVKEKRQLARVHTLPTLKIVAPLERFVRGRLWLHGIDDVQRVRRIFAQPNDDFFPLPF